MDMIGYSIKFLITLYSPNRALISLIPRPLPVFLYCAPIEKTGSGLGTRLYINFNYDSVYHTMINFND